MISLDTKTEASTTSSSPLTISSTKEEPTTLSFSKLLKGFNPKEESKVIQNGALVLSLEKDAKSTEPMAKSTTGKDTLLSLLKSDEEPIAKALEPLGINPKITENMSVKEIKVLISNAKEYLKDKILQSDGYQKAQLKDLPKTLKGLTELAQKIGIDVTKVTIEEVQTKAPKSELSKISQTTESKVDSQLKSTVEVRAQGEVKEASKTINTIKSDVKEDSKAQVSTKNINLEDKNIELKSNEDKKLQTTAQNTVAKETPLFKAQTTTEHSTEQLVATKQFKVDEKKPLTRADETLKLLLRGDKNTPLNSTLTADFSVATAKVIAPNTRGEVTKSLESLLHGESSDSNTNSKIDGLTTHKADSFEVKLSEAKQMIKYLSNDVKTAIEDYKSPFTRVKVQLNPQKLGEVDLTIVQRGKNLHVNISSNSTAISTLATNVNELRTQLNNSGINNATLNFNNSSQNEQQNPSGGQNRQNERDAHEEYNYFENEEASEEILSSLEIVVPSYA